jgi:hypothetical protein
MLEHHNTMSDGTATSVESAKPTISELVNRYHSIGKRSVRAILDIGILLVEAEKQVEEGDLAEADLNEFYERINLRRDGSTAKKYKAIGKKASMLESRIELIPNNWTTMAQLAQLEKDQFDRLVQDNILHPGVTWRAIEDHFVKANQSVASHIGGIDAAKSEFLSFDFNRVKVDRRADFARKLKSLFEEFEVDVGEKVISTLEKFIEQGGAIDA